jgi:hypothetical protein
MARGVYRHRRVLALDVGRSEVNVSHHMIWSVWRCVYSDAHAPSALSQQQLALVAVLPLGAF